MMQLLKYFAVSAFVALIDAMISITLFNVFEVHQLIATNMGIVVGFIIQYIISIKWVFGCKQSLKTINIFLITWLLGVAIANMTVYILLEKVQMSYAISKIGSMAMSFFVLYGIRKKWLEK